MEFNLKNVRHNVGDKVVALDSLGGLVSGKTYTVLDCEFCKKCGIQSIHVGLFEQGPPFNYEECECGLSEPCQPTRAKFKYSDRFAPLQEIDSLMASAIETENYELAEVLKKAQPSHHPDEQEK